MFRRKLFIIQENDWKICRRFFPARNPHTKVYRIKIEFVFLYIFLFLYIFFLPSWDFFSDGSHEKMDSGFLGFPYSGSPLDPAGAGHQIFINQAPPLGLNPIDRLYSMQTSYFCGEESALVDQ